MSGKFLSHWKSENAFTLPFDSRGRCLYCQAPEHSQASPAAPGQYLSGHSLTALSPLSCSSYSFSPKAPELSSLPGILVHVHFELWCASSIQSQLPFTILVSPITSVPPRMSILSCFQMLFRACTRISPPSRPCHTHIHSLVPNTNILPFLGIEGRRLSYVLILP